MIFQYLFQKNWNGKLRIITTKISFDPKILEQAKAAQQEEERSMGMSTCAKTKESTRLKLKEAKEHIKEVEAVNKASEATIQAL